MTHELKVINPTFDTPVVDLVISLNNLRDKSLLGTTPPCVFFQVKDIFHWVESIESARIEGNHTTLADYVVDRLENKEIKDKEKMLEISNIEAAMQFTEEYFENDNCLINNAFISELHRLIVKDLEEEGDRTPGAYRNHNVSIKNSSHKPMGFSLVLPYMDELIQYINKIDKPKYDLLKIAIAHHRFTWIHPFGNGNGRTVRLITYAMLIKQGFNVAKGRILNPTAVFCSDRNKYNEMLSIADTGTNEATTKWCEYVLAGLKKEIEKIDQLLDYDVLKKTILIPALKECFEVKKVITNEQYLWLKVAIGRIQL